MKDIKRRYDIDYTKILAQKLQTVPAYKDLAQACNDVLGQQVDERRRRLEKIKDSVKYRRGDTLVDIVYEPESDKLAILDGTNTTLDIPYGTKIRIAKVKNVIKNIAYFTNTNSKDYLDLQFDYGTKTVRWLKPIDIPQERDALLKNAYIMGFDFFNTKLNDEDLQRLYETIQMYWPESGSDDNFMKYIGFIKNARFDLIPLWSYESDDDVYPVLQDKTKDVVSVKDGGNWFLTSHVEIRYDISQFNEFYTLNLDDLETLFYYFAPIILVLERIVGSLDITIEHGIISVADLTVDNYETTNVVFDNTVAIRNQKQAAIATVQNYSNTELAKDFKVLDGVMSTNDLTIINFDKYDINENDYAINPSFTVDLNFKSTVDMLIYNHSRYDFFNYGSSENTIEFTRTYKKHATETVVQNYCICEGLI